MKVKSNFMGNDTKINANAIAVVEDNKGKALDEYLKEIVEVSSNDKGNYLKLNNGIMICYGLQQFSSNFKDYWTNMKATDPIQIEYPAKFIEPTYSYLTVGDGDNNWLGVQDNTGGSVSKSQLFRVYRPPVQGDGAVTFSIQYLAIGKWK